jgi:ribosomal protein L7Ae-like RNA K-turn-binding protein
LEKKNKAITLIGFAIKAGKCRIGTNAIATLKRVYLIIVCKSASDNTKKQAKDYGVKFHANVMVSVNKTLEEITYKENAKMLAITDRDFAKSIQEYAESEFSIQC